MEFAFLGAGLALLLIGSECAARGGVSLAVDAGISPLLIGLLVIAAASAAPELAVSLRAGLAGTPDIAVGTIVGSNIVNLLLVLGLGAIIRPMPSPPKVVVRDGGSMLIASGALALIALGHLVSRAEGVVLLLAFVAYLAAIVMTDWRRPPEHSVACARAVKRLHAGRLPTPAAFVVFLLGLASLALGGYLTVATAVRLSALSGIPQSVLGLTVVAFGTSLPELLLTTVAASRGRTELAIGQLIGANVFNVLAVLGVTAVIWPLPIAPSLAGIDIPILVAASAVFVPMLATHWRLSRAQGTVLFLAYLVYMTSLALRGLFAAQLV
jgi:cation:H+ antiporter